MSSYLKAIVAIIIAALIAVQTAMSHGHISGSDWITIALAALGAVGVYLVPNKP